MLDNFDDNYSDEIPYLKISDFNTTGMEYVPNDLSNSFQAFVHLKLVSKATAQELLDPMVMERLRIIFFLQFERYLFQR